MEIAERELLEQTVREALEGAPAGSGDGVLAELGWLEMLAAEPRDAIEVVFTALGATDASATVLDDVLAAALGVEPSPSRAVLLPPFGSWAHPGTFAAGGVLAVGLATARAVEGAELVVVCGGPVLQCAVVPEADVERRPVRGIDPRAGLVAVHVDRARATKVVDIKREVWDDAIAAGRRALGHQISGACRTMLALAREHALDRVQFGRPIASFQAVRHRLAEALVAVEALDATLAAAWNVPVPLTAALAKAAAGRAARTTTSHCQQVLAGIGFTTDHPFHRYLKRTLALEGLLGSADELVVDVGRTVLTTRTVPSLVDL